MSQLTQSIAIVRGANVLLWAGQVRNYAEVGGDVLQRIQIM